MTRCRRKGDGAQGEEDMQHLDEGTIHAWLDGQLPRDAATAVEVHVAECRQCADAVAEARGLVAASSRILLALDGAPRGVLPAPATQRARRRWFSGPSLAAAATIIVAVGTFTVMRAGNQDGEVSAPDASAVVADRAAEVAADTQGASAASVAVPPFSTPAPAVAGSDAANEARLRASADERRALAEGIARRAPDQAAIGRTEPTPPAPAAPQKAEAEQQSAQRADFAKKSTEQVVAAPRPRPDTARVQVFRGTKAETARVLVDSPARDVAAAAAVVARGTVRGRVTDANRTPLEGALVQVRGTSTGVTTSSSGDFELRGVPTGAQQITARRIGYAADTLGVTIAAGQPASADFTLVPEQTKLENVVVTGTSEARSRAAPARAEAAAPRPAESSTAYGCYDLGITPATSQARSDFRQVPRRIALDSTVVPGPSDGEWYQARDLAGVSAAGIWRPTSAGSIEVRWTYGTRTATIRLTGVGAEVLRGHASEIDTATALGASATVVAAKTRCPAG